MDHLPQWIKDSLHVFSEWWPGIAGSLTAIVFFKEHWAKLIALFACGVFAAKYLAPTVAVVMRSEATVAGYVTGMFSMAIIGTVFELINAINAKRVMDDLWLFVLKLIRAKK